MHPFRAAVEARDIDAMVAELAEDVIFHSPVAFTPFAGRESVMGLFEALFRTFEEFAYSDEVTQGDTTMLIFDAKVGGKKIQGLDLIRYGDDGKIREFTVMLRPLSGLIAMGEAMKPQVEGLAKGEPPK